jgi:translation initiation factor IF-1
MGQQIKPRVTIRVGDYIKAAVERNQSMDTTGQRKPRITIRAGDHIKVQGVTIMVNKVIRQERFKEGDKYYWDVEFLDVLDGYHYWKQYFDGGEVIYSA